MRRGYIGIGAQTVPVPKRWAPIAGLHQAHAVMVASVESSSPAAKGGVRTGDVIVAVGDTMIAGVDDLLRALHAETIGKTTAIQLVSCGERRTATVVLTERR